MMSIYDFKMEAIQRDTFRLIGSPDQELDRHSLLCMCLAVNTADASTRGQCLLDATRLFDAGHMSVHVYDGVVRVLFANKSVADSECGEGAGKP